ncbi:geranylgeranyl diphosphate synthase type I [Streptomyces sp. PanSC9]|nr:geranylgeranyl diphosphate synthase type I [Streptomyces sp. PanSC9]
MSTKGTAMRPTQATDHHEAGAPPAFRLVALARSPVRVRSGGPRGSDGSHGSCESDAARSGPSAGRPEPDRCGGPDGFAGVRAADRDVRAAVSRVLDQELAERLERSRAVDPVFADDLALRVAHFTQRGGKRVRSQLLWWAMRACGGGDDTSALAALRLGAAVELLQTCALVQDDVMDRSPRRRGRPAMHADIGAQYGATVAPDRAGRFGEAAAVLAGDLALAWADDLVAGTALPAGTGHLVRRLWGDLRTEMVAGQYLDLQGQITGSRSLPRALRSACLKSALYSVERPLALGAALAGADGTTTGALCSAGRRIGMAFQLRDDVGDVFSDDEGTGRPAGGDIREGKSTCLTALARARAEAAGDRLALTVLDRALGKHDLSPADLEEVRDILRRTGALATVEAKAGRLVAQGLRRFDAVPLDPAGAGPLRDLLVAAAGGTPAGPPGRPEGASANRPAGRPEATPANRPAGRFEGTPANRPAGRFEGPPATRPAARAQGSPANGATADPHPSTANAPAGRPHASPPGGPTASPATGPATRVTAPAPAPAPQHDTPLSLFASHSEDSRA